MGRDWLLTRLAAYRPADAADRACRDRLAAFVSAHADCFSRDLAVGHVVASAWVVGKGRGHVLLHHHKKLDRWLQFGGHVDGEGDHTVLDAARRELAEESGLVAPVLLGDGIFDLDIHDIPANPKEPAHLHLDVRFAFEVDENAAFGVSDESHALRWFSLEEAARRITEPSIVRMLEKTVDNCPIASPGGARNPDI
ncbi:MAG: NUDIX hydrolase [Leptospirillia bacterium]